MLERLLAPHADRAYAILRVVAGFMFAFHGLQKVLGVLAEAPQRFGSQLWIGGLIELVCGLAVAVGLFTRFSAFLCSGTMAVAYVQYHWQGQLGKMFLPRFNEGELAALYAVVFLYIACRGPGPWSVQAVAERRYRRLKGL